MMNLLRVAIVLSTITTSTTSIVDKTVPHLHLRRTDGVLRTGRDVFQKRSLSTSRSNNVWNVIGTMDEYKKGKIFTRNGDRKKTFSSFHYLVLPIWWSDENRKVPIDVNEITAALDGAAENYSKQSWGKLSVSYEILEQWRIGLSKFNTRYLETLDACFTHVKNQGYVKGKDFNGILMVHNAARSGVFGYSGGGLAAINGDFATMSTPLSWRVTRHELGHNFGHYHHSHNHYNYRFSRPGAPSIIDGFDMMSGGNGETKSDFGVASKWYYNWVNDNSIISMQPEGRTEVCPSCVRSGAFTLKAFDNWLDTPTTHDKLGIHIPVLAVYDEYWESYNVYSYWLSYRGGNNFAKNGLSLHMSYFELARSTMGAWYDSMNYDAVGFSDNKTDSFVTVGSCYHLSPPGFLLDRDIVSASAVQPVVCVDSIDLGASINVTVNFLENETPPEPSVDVEEYSMPCTSKSFEVDSSKYNLFHVNGMGENGHVTVSLSSTAGNASAFFFDDYPYSPLVYGALPTYGSMKRLESGAVGGCTEIYGAIAIKITNNRAQPLALNEISLYDSNGENVALQAKCYSKTSSSTGNPECLNDNDVGHYPQSCISESAEKVSGNFDFCVLPGPADIKTIRIDPAKQIGNDRLTNKNRNLKVELFARVIGLENVVDSKNAGDEVSFSGNLASFDLLEVFTGNEKAPWVGTVDMDLPYSDCNDDDREMPQMTYQSLLGEVYTLVPPWSGGTTYLKVSCESSECLTNQYMNGGSCKQCPENHRAQPGSTSASACWHCPDGTELPHPLASWCLEKENVPTPSPTKEPAEPTTPQPTSKSTLPTSQPTPKPSSFLFLLSVKNGTPILRKCSWLEKKPVEKVFSVCQKTESYQDYFPAREVCTVCCMDSDNDFYLKRGTDKNGNVVPITETCEWLKGKKKRYRKKLCSRKRSFKGIIFPAQVVCRGVCGTCS